MKRVAILIEFHDKEQFTKVYKVGEEHEFDDERAEFLAHRGLVKIQGAIAIVNETPHHETEEVDLPSVGESTPKVEETVVEEQIVETTEEVEETVEKVGESEEVVVEKTRRGRKPKNDND